VEVLGMGGRRHDARPTTDEALALDVRDLARRGGLVPGRHTHAWPSRWGQGSAIAYTAAADHLVLDYRLGRSWSDPAWWRGGDGRDARQVVWLETTPCHFGGARPWFVCLCGRRVAVLFFFGGSFRCRACHSLAYASTREGPAPRMLRKADRLRAKLGGAPGLGSLPEQPPWLGTRAYLRALWRIHELDQAYAGALAGEVAEMRGRFERGE
jgi:hypothetical protein